MTGVLIDFPVLLGFEFWLLSGSCMQVLVNPITSRLWPLNWHVFHQTDYLC